MTATDQLLRDTFAAEAATIQLPPDTRARVGGLARRYRARRAAAVAGAATAAAAVAFAVPTAVTALTTPIDASAVTASTTFGSWAPRGALGADDAFVAAAAAAWDSAVSPATPHTDVQVLWADVIATGRAAVLVGTDEEGSRRLAVVGGGSPTLKVVRDVQAPTELSHVSFNLFTDDAQHSAASYTDTLVVITPPASGWTVEWTGGTHPESGHGTAATDDGIAVVDISQSGPDGHPTIRVLDGSTIVYDGPIGSQR